MKRKRGRIGARVTDGTGARIRQRVANLGAGDCGGGSFSAGRASASVPTGTIARRYFASRAAHNFLFSDCDMHCAERSADGDFVDCGSDAAIAEPKLYLCVLLQGLKPCYRLCFSRGLKPPPPEQQHACGPNFVKRDLKR